MLTHSATTDGTSTGCQPITILGDSVEEDNETFSVTASVASPNMVTQPSTIFVIIVDDNDGTFDDCVVRFRYSQYATEQLTVIAASLCHKHTFTHLCQKNVRITYASSYISIYTTHAVADCGQPPDVDNANPSTEGRQTSSGGAAIDSIATYICIPGYALVGNATRVCQADSIWSGSSPTCEGTYPRNSLYQTVHRC